MQFSLNKVVNILTGRFVSGDMGDVYEVMDYLRSYNHSTFELVYASDECKEAIQRQHPVFTDTMVESITNAISLYKNSLQNIEEWNAQQLEQQLRNTLGLSNYYELKPISEFPMSDDVKGMMFEENVKRLQDDYPHLNIIDVDITDDEPPVSPYGDINW